MIKSICCLVLFLPFLNYAQKNNLEAFESNLKKELGDLQTFQKHVVDLNNDTQSDVIYLYSCGEPLCVNVFLNINDSYQSVLYEQCSNYDLYKITDGKLALKLNLFHCCGESPYESIRSFEFNGKSAILKENYVKINEKYILNNKIIVPEYSLLEPYFVRNTVTDYNIRSTPSVETLEKREIELFTYGCEVGTNIIAKINLNSKIKVLSELIQNDRTWLFVEIEGSDLNSKCNPVDFEFKNQKLRGWISSKFITKI